MITRRDALKIAASMSAVVPMLPMGAREALAALDRPIGEAVPTKTDQRNATDPVAFAEYIDGTDFGRDVLNIAPEAQAELLRRMHALEHAIPALATDPTLHHLWNQLSDAAFTYAIESGWAGVRAGAAYENLRIALMSPTMICPDCFSVYGMENRDRATCTRCNGAGVVATPGVRAA